MTSPAPILLGEPDRLPDGLPEGTIWRGPDTLVLMNRQIRSDADPARISRFADDRWDLNPGIFGGPCAFQSLNFEIIPEPLRLAHRIVEDLHRRTTDAEDGYVARENLAHPLFTEITTDRQVQNCCALVRACALGTETIPDEKQVELTAALRASDSVIRESLASP